MADQFPMLSLTPDVPDPVAPSAAPAQSIQQQPAAAASTTAVEEQLRKRREENRKRQSVPFVR